MSAEAIGRVIRDFKRGSVLPTDPDAKQFFAYIGDTAIIDVTAIYDEWHRTGKTWNIYEDSVCRPPLLDANYSWVNQFGNVLVASVITYDREYPDWEWGQWQPDDQDHSIDWEQVQWVSTGMLWAGGYSIREHEHVPTYGPIGIVSFAINADGVVQDFHWVATTDVVDDQEILYYMSVVTQAITFLNCRNVEVLEPTRSRPERRRVERTGVSVKEIHVKPIGVYRKVYGKRMVPLSESGPLSMVRGHVARYGPRWGRGLLFGKYEGEYWIPPHSRGSAEVGEVQHEYVVE